MHKSVESVIITYPTAIDADKSAMLQAQPMWLNVQIVSRDTIFANQIKDVLHVQETVLYVPSLDVWNAS